MSSSRTRTLPLRPSPEYCPPRALLSSLNGANSWLLSLPRPAEERARPGSKAYFHAVLNPCLTDPTTVGATAAGPSRSPSSAAVPSRSSAGPSRSSSRCVTGVPSLNSPSTSRVNQLAEVEDIISRIEEAAVCGNFIASPANSTAVDAILLNVPHPDHDLDEATLRTFRPQTPVLATPDCLAAVRRWNHFRNLTEMRGLDSDSDSDSDSEKSALLPAWLSVSRLPGDHELDFCTAIVYSPPSPAQEEYEHDEPKVLLYSSNGVTCSSPSFLRVLFRPTWPIWKT